MNVLVFLPAFNEGASLRLVLPELAREVPGMDVLVVSDGSTDETVAVARRAGVRVLDLPVNLGVGGAVQAGFSYAYRHGYDYAIRIDADGQHPPSEIPRLLEALRAGDADVVTASRFLGHSERVSSRFRSLGIALLANFLSAICRASVTDPTSGFQGVNRLAMALFASSYPHDYPEPEALALLSRLGFRFRETGAVFRPRLAGTSTIGELETLFFAFKVFLALCVGRARNLDEGLSRSCLARQLQEGRS
ncbi:MAG: glycosyltransferase family 2 protein [Kiritimatiellia bacterium]